MAELADAEALGTPRTPLLRGKTRGAAARPWGDPSWFESRCVFDLIDKRMLLGLCLSMTVSDQDLKEIVAKSISFSDAMRKSGRKPQGASLQYFKTRIIRLGLDVSHFLGRAACAGRFHPGRARKKTWQEILISNGDRIRVRVQIFRRAFREYCQEMGIPEVCSECSNPPFWNNKPLRLHVDHINSDCGDHTPKNLRWLCPNCHDQKTTYGPVAETD